MSKLFCAVFIIFSLLACHHPVEVAPDDMVVCQQPEEKPGKAVVPEFDLSSKPRTITVIVYPDYDTLNQAYDEYAKEDRPRVYGWARWSDTQCEINVIKPVALKTKVIDTWGHELAHCIYGHYHGK